MEEQWTDRRWIFHSLKTYCTCYTFNSSAEKRKPISIFIHSLCSMYNINSYSHIPSQIFPFFWKTNILIKFIILIVWPINQTRSWPGVFRCPSHHPGHLCQAQEEQEQLSYSCGLWWEGRQWEQRPRSGVEIGCARCKHLESGAQEGSSVPHFRYSPGNLRDFQQSLGFLGPEPFWKQDFRMLL